MKEFRAFRKLALGKTNRENLWEEKDICRKTLSVKFKVFFDKSISPEVVWRLLPPKLTTSDDPWVLGIDGKWLHRNGVVVIYRDITRGENLFWSYWSSESYLALFTDLERLTRLLSERRPVGVVSDWKGAIVNAVSNLLPGIPHQRCLAHVVREAKRLLPQNSGFLATSTLRRLASQLSRVKTNDDKRRWLANLIEWERIFGHRLKEKTTNPETGKKWWYTHGNLRRAWRLLTDNWDPFFVYLDHTLIPNSNNSLEGTNSQIKRQLNNHRGMKTPQQISFLFWYLSFTRTKTKQSLKKLWDWWKT